MEYADHVQAVERETRLMALAFEDAPLDARVPTCPDFTLADLAAHVTSPRLHLGPREADLTLSGTASDLALVLFERPPIDIVQEDGDPTTLAAWYREFRFD